jgi:hypothetical protein
MRHISTALGQLYIERTSHFLPSQCEPDPEGLIQTLQILFLLYDPNRAMVGFVTTAIYRSTLISRCLTCKPRRSYGENPDDGQMQRK